MARAEQDVGRAFDEAARALGLEMAREVILGVLLLEGIVQLLRDINRPNRKRVRSGLQCYALLFVGTPTERRAREEALPQARTR